MQVALDDRTDMKPWARIVWTWYALCVAQLCAVAVAADMSQPVYVLDLSRAPWANIGLAAVAAQLGGLWGFLQRLTKDEIPRKKVYLHFATDMLAAMISGVVVVLFADSYQWSVGNALLGVLGAGVASSKVIETIRERGASVGRPGL